MNLRYHHGYKGHNGTPWTVERIEPQRHFLPWRYVTVDSATAAIFAVDPQRRGKDPIAKRPRLQRFDLGDELGEHLAETGRAGSNCGAGTGGVRHRIRAPQAQTARKQSNENQSRRETSY